MNLRVTEIRGWGLCLKAKLKKMDMDISLYDGLPASIEPLFRQCHNVETITIGRCNVHESTEEVLQTLTPSPLPTDHVFHQLPFKLGSELYLPLLHTIELPGGNEDRIRFGELLNARYARKAPLYRLIIPPENHEPRRCMPGNKGMPPGFVRERVIGRLRSFAADVGAAVLVKETSPQGKRRTCPTEILFDYSPPA